MREFNQSVEKLVNDDKFIIMAKAIREDKSDGILYDSADFMIYCIRVAASLGIPINRFQPIGVFAEAVKQVHIKLFDEEQEN